jgi:hypothetical protein
MKNLVSSLLACGAIAGLVSACAVDASPVEEAGVVEEAACANQQGTNAMIAALAVAVGNELGRWNISKDFTLVTGAYNQQHLALTSTGLSRCTNGCANVKALLSFQDARYDNILTFPGGEKLSAWSYAARLVAGYNEQRVCESRPSNNTSNPNNCPAEEHKLTLVGTSPGACDMNFTYNARTPSGGMLIAPSLLKNKLLWASGNYNPYISFSSTPGTVTIDPTWDLNSPGSTTQPGSCTNACAKFSTTSIAGQCCSCGGVQKAFKVSPTSTTTYLCN